MVDALLAKLAPRHGLTAITTRCGGGTFFVQVVGGKNILTASSVDVCADVGDAVSNVSTDAASRTVALTKHTNSPRFGSIRNIVSVR